jgi:hypothetical protein
MTSVSVKARRAQSARDRNANRRTGAASSIPGGAILSDGHYAAMASFPFFEYMQNPEDHLPMRVPDGHAGVTAVFKSPLNVTLPFSGVWLPSQRTSSDPGVPATNGYTEIIIAPGSAGCVFHTLGVTGFVFDETSLPGDTMIPCMASHPGINDVVGGLTYMSHGLRVSRGVTVDIACIPKRGNDGIPWYEMNWRNTAGGGINLGTVLRFINHSTNTVRELEFGITVLYEDDGTFNTITNIGEANNTVAFIIPPSPTGSSNVTAFAVFSSDVDPSSHWTFNIETLGLNFNTLVMPGNSACAFQVLDAPELSTLRDVESERQAALSGLVTYLGSDLENGGHIAGARLGLGLSPVAATNGDVISHLASLPFYNADHALKEGMYAWWLPDSEQEHFYKPYKRQRTDILETDSLIHIAMSRDNPSQDVRLRTTHGIEVITRSRTYASNIAPVNPSYQMMVSAMKKMPAVLINFRHKGFLARAWGGIKNWIKKPANWMKMLRTGGDAVSIVSPELGGRINRGADVLGRLGANVGLF